MGDVNPSEEALKLPHEFTLGFSPYAGDTGKWAVKARAEGFESVVDLPMQTEEYPISDPGSYGLLEDLSPDENISRLHSVLMPFPGFIRRSLKSPSPVQSWPGSREVWRGSIVAVAAAPRNKARG